MERADSLARLLEAAETHSRDEHGDQDWELILEVNGDVEKFRKRYKKSQRQMSYDFIQSIVTTPDRLYSLLVLPAKMPDLYAI